MSKMLEIITEMRGGIPDKCSFCEQPFDERGAIPEEAGDWACYPCWDKWAKESAK